MLAQALNNFFFLHFASLSRVACRVSRVAVIDVDHPVESNLLHRSKIGGGGRAHKEGPKFEIELVDVELTTSIRYVTKPFFLLLSASLERYGEEEEAIIISI